MVILDDSPFLPRLFHQFFDLIVGGRHLALLQDANINRVFEDAQDHTGTPGGFLLGSEFGGIAHSQSSLVVQGRRDTHYIEPVRNIPRANPIQFPFENVPHYIGSIIIYHQAVLVLRILQIPENSKRANEISAFAFDFKLAPNLDRGIPAICLVYEIFEWNDQFIGFHISVFAVIVVVDSDKAHTQKGKDTLDVFSRFQVVPAKPGQVLDHDAVDFSSLNFVHHCLKSRTVKVGTGITVIHFHAALPKLRVTAQIVTDQVFLPRDTVALLLVPIFPRQADIAASIPYLIVHCYLSQSSELPARHLTTRRTLICPVPVV